MALGLPDIGTGSLYYSQYDSSIVDLLTNLSDNTSNLILAKNVRDSIWSLYNNITTVASQSLTQSQNYYTLGTPSTISVGGINSGSTFSNISFQSFFDQMLLAYVAPTINSFDSSITTLQFGQSTPLSLNYSISSGSVPLSIINFSGPYLPIMSDGGPFNANPYTGVRVSIVPTYSTTVAATQTDVFTMSVVTTDLLSFTTSTTLTYKHKIYYGPLTIPIGFTYSSPSSVLAVQSFLTDNVIKGLSYSGLSSNVNISQLMTFNNQYLIFAAPTVLGFNYPYGFFIDNQFSQDFTKIKSGVTFSNEFSYKAPFDVWISNSPYSDSALVSNYPQSIGNTSSVYTVLAGPQGPAGSNATLANTFLPKYNSDAAAGSAGLTGGSFYQTGGSGSGVFAFTGVVMVKQYPALSMIISSPTYSIVTGTSPGVLLGTASGGYGAFFYQWFNGSGAISGATGTTYSPGVMNSSNTFFCQVTNLVGTVNSTIINITVHS